MKRFLVTGLAATALLAYSSPANAFWPVSDVLAEPVWLKTLVQDTITAQNLKQQVTMQIKNLMPTRAPWAQNANSPVAMAPILDTAIASLNQYNAQISQNTGQPVAQNQALEIAERNAAQLNADQADLASATDASDSCEGDLCAQQVSHRFNQLQVSQQIRQGQFEQAKYIEDQKSDAEAMAWLSGASYVAVPADNNQ